LKMYKIIKGSVFAKQVTPSSLCTFKTSTQPRFC
jgi:hypothetical protein